jgi:nucleotide-binding universal stress UspA family protein
MKILLATDGSEYSENAAKFLTRLNFTPDDEILILHAATWLPIINEWAAVYADIKELQDEVVPKILDSASDALKTVKAKITTSFAEDYPDKAIVDTSEESGVDLIVMGARGIRGMKSHIIGSVTKLVALNSHKPVLIIKPYQDGKSEGLKILFATDGSTHSDAVAKILSAIPFPDNTELTILNVVPTVFEDIPERFAMEINDRIKNIVAGTREKELKTSEEIMEKAYKGLSGKFSKMEKRTKFGDPSVEIPRIAETTEADIVAIGTRGTRGIKGMFGSVSRYIINHSGCSLLIAK